MLKIHYQIESTENIHIKVHMYFHKSVEIIKPMDWNKFSNFEQFAPVNHPEHIKWKVKHQLLKLSSRAFTFGDYQLFQSSKV